MPPTPAASLARAPRSGWRAAWDFLRGPYPALLSRVVVGGVFLLAGISKALDTRAFASEISAYQIAPAGLVQPLAIALPLLEILIGVYLLLGLMQRWAAAAAGALLLIFIGAMTWALARGLTLDCGCFGNALGLSALRETVSVGSIARDVLWLLLAIHLLIVPGTWSLDAFRQKHAHRLSIDHQEASR
jgi:uncharacterized membrane protein YphA (DoxX/SURF4 family)